MSGFSRIFKDCTSLRTWSMIGTRGDVGLRLKITRRGTIVFLGVVYGHTYVTMCIGCFVQLCF
ncbi:hypothetical protein Hanom_Chr03g00214281 [Helianthus anomalus]